MIAYHDHAGHSGVKRTYAAIHLKYYWPKLYQNVYDYVTSCDKCQREKLPTHPRPAPLQLLPNVDTFDRWHMDILTGFLQLKKGISTFYS